MHAGQIMILVTGVAFNRICSLSVGSTPDLHRVLMPVVSLTRKISSGVTIHAPRMPQYRNNGIKSIGRTVARGWVLHRGDFGMFGLSSGMERQQEGG
jgi:hypothetical protein